ncbi:hypothetical protein [Litoreibacter ascidiaceicola]|nr:hypothetical protein [Litoreibacter ascidiaceicola]
MLHLIPQVILLSAVVGSSASSATCLAPERPFVPSDPVVAVEYADLIRQDFENYFRGILRYFQCLDGERARVFDEAREISKEYSKFIETIDQ